MKLLQVVAGHRGVHVVLEMPVHVPVEKLRDGVEGDGAHALPEVGDVAPQPAVHGHADEVPEPVGKECGSRNKNRHDGFSDSGEERNDGHVSEQHGTGPPHGLHPLFPVSLVELRTPGIERVVEAVQRDLHEVLQSWYQAPRLVSARDVEREQLREVEDAQRWYDRQHLLAVPLHEEREAVVVAVAEPVDLEVHPAQEGEDPQEGFVEPPRPEHCRVA